MVLIANETGRAHPGNRSGSQGVRDVDDGNGGASTTIVDTSVTVSSDKMNLYTSYAGKAYEFDACEQMTRDRSTETYHRYDWRGQLWRSDIVNSDVSDPERYYTYDCQGRRKTEVQLYKASPAHVYQTFVFISFCACATGGCGGDIAGDFVAQTYTFNSAGAVDFHVEHLIGLGAHGTGSSSATHPAAVFGPGGRPAGDSIVAERVTKGAVEQVYWRYEDQLNSCVGQADENGWRTMQNSYLAFGEVMQSRVLYDGAVSRLSAVEYDGLALTTITLANNDLSTDLLNGALLFLARPGYNGNRHMEAVVVDSTANSIVVEDLTGELFEALGPEGRPIAGFVIFAFNDSKQANAPTYQTHGTWTSAPSFATARPRSRISTPTTTAAALQAG
ncbi:MAG: hypothetical protein BroJett014_20740 [Planctomycetota bacterium]|nr:MAG: hypothetical protein BroJett014_20740 [Planctomycetota bacterium]